MASATPIKASSVEAPSGEDFIHRSNAGEENSREGWVSANDRTSRRSAPEVLTPPAPAPQFLGVAVFRAATRCSAAGAVFFAMCFSGSAAMVVAPPFVPATQISFRRYLSP